MKVKKLKLANVRAIEMGEFLFQPGFNLIVGINGVGKTTVLDSLCICLSRILPAISESRSKARSFEISDIRVGFPFLDVDTSIELGNREFQYTRRQWRERFAKDDLENIERLRREILNTERLRDRARNLLRDLDESHSVSDSDTFRPSLSELKKEAQSSPSAPICLFFSTNRAVVSNAVASKARAVGGPAAAYAEALVARPMQLRHFAEWMRAQRALAGELHIAARHLTVLQKAVSRFLPEYENLRPNTDGEATLFEEFRGPAVHR